MKILIFYLLLFSALGHAQSDVDCNEESSMSDTEKLANYVCELYKYDESKKVISKKNIQLFNAEIADIRNVVINNKQQLLVSSDERMIFEITNLQEARDFTISSAQVNALLKDSKAAFFHTSKQYQSIQFKDAFIHIELDGITDDVNAKISFQLDNESLYKQVSLKNGKNKIAFPDIDSLERIFISVKNESDEQSFINVGIQNIVYRTKFLGQVKFKKKKASLKETPTYKVNVCNFTPSITGSIEDYQVLPHSKSKKEISLDINSPRNYKPLIKGSTEEEARNLRIKTIKKTMEKYKIFTPMFVGGSDEFVDEADVANQLALLIDYLKLNPDLSIELIGVTATDRSKIKEKALITIDGVQRMRDSKELAEARAEKIKRLLIQADVPETQILNVFGVSPGERLDPNFLAAEAYVNRRVDIIFIDQYGKFELNNYGMAQEN